MVYKMVPLVQREGVIRLFKSSDPEKFKDGEQCRDFIYVKDAVAMTLHLAATKGVAGLFNIGAGSARSWLDLAHALFVALNRPPVITFIEMPENIRDQYQYYTCADITRLRATGYSSRITSLEEAVKDYIQGYLVTGKQLGEEEDKLLS